MSPASAATSRLAVLAALLLCVALLGARQPAVLAQEAPAGCAAVFAATTRGGGQPPPGGVCSLLHRPSPGDDAAVVRRVVDGDTVVLTNGERVRYIGIDAPEDTSTREPFGAEATAYNRRLVEGTPVRLERDVSERDRFGRLLRYVWAGGVLVNAELVREGYAEARAFPPDTRYRRCLEALEEEARAARRGMWAAVVPAS